MENHFFDLKNYIAILIGICLVVLGHYLLSIPPVDSWVSTTLAPIILTLTYICYLPFVILMTPKKEKE